MTKQNDWIEKIMTWFEKFSMWTKYDEELKEMLLSFENSLTQQKEAIEKETINRVIEAFQLELKDLPFLPNPDKLLETIIAFGMAKYNTKIDKEWREKIKELLK